MINKVAMIAIVGRANSGKSTLTNRLTGDKVAIVSPKPQTTRNRIYGVFTHNDTQMILLDTPGFHKAKTRLGDYMVGVVKASVTDVDAVVLLVEPVDNIGTQEELLIEHIKKARPNVHISGAVSNISFNLPVRRLINQAFAVLALNAGMDCAVLDPLSGDLRGVILAAEAMLGRDDYCAEYVSAYREGIFT